jgi:hypothetical protein
MHFHVVVARPRRGTVGPRARIFYTREDAEHGASRWFGATRRAGQMMRLPGRGAGEIARYRHRHGAGRVDVSIIECRDGDPQAVCFLSRGGLPAAETTPQAWPPLLSLDGTTRLRVVERRAHVA